LTFKANGCGHMKYYKSLPYILIMLLVFLFTSASAYAQSTTIYQDDFEGTVTGWTINNTDFDPDVTTFLGRFDTSTSRSFTIPASTARVDIVFDFYRFDSWDDNAQWGFDRFQIDIDGTQIFSLPFPNPQAARSGVTGNVDWGHVPLTGTVELAFGTGQWWFDQLHQFTISVSSPGTTLDLTLRCALTQGGNDESCGYDNMTVTAFPILPNLTAQKIVEVSNNDYALPGNFVEYTIAVNNSGGTMDAGTFRLEDPIPDNLSLFTGDFDGAGNAVEFTDLSSPASGLSCCTSAHIEYSNSITDPPVFEYVPVTDYDPAITYLRISPNGAIRDSQIDPVDLEFKFRARID